MENNKKTELDDELLDEVTGGAEESLDPSALGEYKEDVLHYCYPCAKGTTHALYIDGTRWRFVCSICGTIHETGEPKGRQRFDINTA